MSYIRAKIINGRSYLYLVESKREGGRVVQKHIKYLGKGTKADIPAKKKELDFYVPSEIKGKEWREKLYGPERPPLKQKLGTTQESPGKGSGWGAREKGVAIQSIGDIKKGDIILVYNKELDTKNMMVVTEIDEETGNFKGHFIDPKDPSKKRLAGDRTINVWDSDLKDGNYFKQKLGTTKPEPAKELTGNEKEQKYLDQKIPPVKSEYASMDEIDFNRVKSSYNGVSWEPEVRARRQQVDYVNEIDSFAKTMLSQAKTPEQKEQALKEIEQYKKGYKGKLMDYMGAKGRVVSAMIVGPANFPTRRNEKRLDTEGKRLNELMEYRARAKKKGIKRVREAHPEGTTHYARDKLKRDIDRDIEHLERVQARVGFEKHVSRTAFTRSLAGKIRRRIANGDYEGAVESYDYLNAQAKKKGIKQVFAKSNKLHKQISDIRGKKAPAKATGTSTVKTYKTAKVINNQEAERVQILFDDIPSTEIRNDLKARGFRWSRREGAWQRKNTRDGLYMSTSILDKHLEPEENIE